MLWMYGSFASRSRSFRRLATRSRGRGTSGTARHIFVIGDHAATLATGREVLPLWQKEKAPISPMVPARLIL